MQQFYEAPFPMPVIQEPDIPSKTFSCHAAWFAVVECPTELTQPYFHWDWPNS